MSRNTTPIMSVDVLGKRADRKSNSSVSGMAPSAGPHSRWAPPSSAMITTSHEIVALKAIDAKDTEGLSSAGGDIDMACESCHTKYWYPNKKPS